MKLSEGIKKLMDLYLEHGDIELVRDNAYMSGFDKLDNDDIKMTYSHKCGWGNYSYDPEFNGVKIIAI